MNANSPSVLTSAPTAAADSHPGMLLVQTLFSPRAAFREIRRDPHWLPPLLVFTLVTFVHTVVAMPFTMARITSQMRAMNPSLRDEASMERMAETPRIVVGVVSLLSSVLAPLVIVLAVAGLVHLLSVLLKGDLDVRGRAVFSACAYASLPLALGTLARVPLMLRQRTLDVSLGFDALFAEVFRPGELTRLLQFFDGFRLWFAVLLAVVVAVLYRLNAGKALGVSLVINTIWFGFYVLMAGIWRL